MLFKYKEYEKRYIEAVILLGLLIKYFLEFLKNLFKYLQYNIYIILMLNLLKIISSAKTDF